MISLQFSHIPKYLHESDFYQNLSSDDCFDVPLDCYCENDENIESKDDLYRMVRVMRFWGLKRYLRSVLKFCFSIEYQFWMPTSSQDENSELSTLSQAFGETNQFSLQRAIETGGEFVEFWFSEVKPDSEHGRKAIAQACMYGRLDLVKALLDEDFPKDKYAFAAAAQYGHIDILHSLHKYDCPLDTIAMTFAALGNQLESMKYLHSINCSWNDDISLVCMGSLSFYQTFQDDIPWREDFVNSPPESNGIQCLRFAIENGCPIHPSACAEACRYGRYDCLLLLHEFGAPWSYRATYKAALGGHIECLQFLHENGCPWDDSTAKFAAGVGQIKCLRYACENGCPYDENIVEYASTAPTVDCLRYLIEDQQTLMTGTVLNNAIVAGNYESVVYLCDIGCPMENLSITLLHLNDDDFSENDSIVMCLAYALDRGLPIGDNLLQFVTMLDENKQVKYPQCNALIRDRGVIDQDGVFHYWSGGEEKQSLCFSFS